MSGDKHLPKLGLVGVCLHPDFQTFLSKTRTERLGQRSSAAWYDSGFLGACLFSRCRQALRGVSHAYSGLAWSRVADGAHALQPVLMDTLSCVGR